MRMNEQEIKQWAVFQRFSHKTGNLSPWKIKLLKDNRFDFQPQYGHDFISFEKARKFVWSLELKSTDEWRIYAQSVKKPHNFPCAPDIIYKDEWVSWPDFLGTKIGFNGSFLSFKKARKFAHSLKLKDFSEWELYSKSGKRPHNIPSSPRTKYSGEWVSTHDWLGTKRGIDGMNIGINIEISSSRRFLSFKNARRFVRKLNLKNQKEWQLYATSNERPSDIPNTPSKVYKKEWKGLRDWLGS